MNLDVRRLRLLRELEARGTIAAVAEAFSFSASAISQQLAQLERETGVQLLERVGRGVQLTPAAHSIIGHVDAILVELDAVEATLERIGDEPRGRVRLTTFQSAGINLVPLALTILASEAPRVRVEVLEAEAEAALPALAAGRVDLVLAEDYLGVPRMRDPRLDYQELFRDAILLALPDGHPLAQGGGPVSVEALADASWGCSLEGTLYAAMMARVCNELGGFTPDIRHRSNDLSILIALVATGHAVALVPELMVVGDRPGVALREIADRPLRRTVFAAARRRYGDHPAIASVSRALIEAATLS